MPTNKRGEKYTWKEFFQQWKQGIKEVTPLQQCIMTQLFLGVMVIGFIWGIIFTIITGTWWLMIILIAGLGLNLVNGLGNWQKLIILKDMDKMMKEAELNTKEVKKC